ncbi:TonB-dependent receptor [Qipengyuania flava]|uniref:TonB-dependent receptor n=1 Tax=Qipengyuania flava TaxID=192812 RepID=UPI00273D2481|nr:TonB-dependent receptor [Qipengyuania flava]
MAQDDASGAADGPNDANVIIVTAQKRSQDLQDVPLAISAFDEGALEDKVIDDAVDLSFSVPNLTVDIFGASLRGVGDLAISATSESGLGYHVNGVYLGSAATEAEYYDLERIEVLRGPQGTLYGRNTTAGVINIITRKASDQFEGYVTAGYGNYNSIKLRGAINVPIAEGFSTRLAGFVLDRDGYATNLYTGTRVDDREMFGLRSSTRLDLGDTQADLVVSYFKEDDRRMARTKVLCVKDPLLGCSPLANGSEAPDSRGTLFNTLGALTGTIATGFGPAAVDYYAASFNPADTRVVNEDLDPTYFVEEWTASLEITHEFGALSLTSLTGYHEVERELFKDFDRLVPSLGLTRPVTFDLFANGNPVTTMMIQTGRRDLSESREWYQELRLASDFDGPFNFILGGNYYDRRASSSAQFTHATIAARQQLGGLSAEFDALISESNPVTTQSLGLFGEAYFDLSSRTTLTAGLRYSHDDKTILTRQIFLNPQPDGSLPAFTSGSFEKGVVTGRLVLDHQLSDDLLGYVSLSRGYKAGGINPGEVGVQTSGFAPEFLNAVELGLKGATSDGTFSANLSGFYYDYEGLQIGQTTPTSALTVNTDARILGVEAEFAVRPTPRLQIDGSFSYLDTTIRGFQSIDETDPFGTAPGTVVAAVTPAGVIKDLDGNELPFSPDVKLSVGLQYAIPLGDWDLTPRLDHYQQSAFSSSVFNKPADEFDGYSQTDFKLLFAPDGGTWELRGYVKNIFDNDDITRVLPAGRLVGRFREVVVLEPRTYGIEATIRF